MEEACEHVWVWRGSCYSLHVWLSIFSHLILSTAQEARTIQPPARNPACAMNTGVLGMQCWAGLSSWSTMDYSQLRPVWVAVGMCKVLVAELFMRIVSLRVLLCCKCVTWFLILSDESRVFGINFRRIWRFLACPVSKCRYSVLNASFISPDPLSSTNPWVFGNNISQLLLEYCRHNYQTSQLRSEKQCQLDWICLCHFLIPQHYKLPWQQNCLAYPLNHIYESFLFYSLTLGTTETFTA